MRAASLFTGGKDSTYSLFKAIEAGYDPAVLITMIPESDDSYFYHSRNIELTSLMAESMEMNIIKFPSESKKEREKKELREAIEEASTQYEFDSLVAGAVESNYQRKRVEEIAKKLELDLYLPLWHIDIEEYMKRLVEDGFEAIITSVSAAGLDKSFLGKKIDAEVIDELIEIRNEYEINLAGEGGEYETTVVNAPIFNKKIKIENSEINYDEEKIRGNLNIKNASLA